LLSIKINIDDHEVNALLRGVSARGKNLKPAMKSIGQLVRTSVIKNFETGGRPAWKPLSEATIFGSFKGQMVTKRGKLRKPVERKLGFRKILIDTGRLMKSLNSKAYPDRAEVGTNVVYAAIHQFGGPAGRGRKVNVPARPFLMVQDEDWSGIKDILIRHLTGDK
jgi:phage virion morphogenesis protein